MCFVLVLRPRNESSLRLHSTDNNCPFRNDNFNESNGPNQFVRKEERQSLIRLLEPHDKVYQVAVFIFISSKNTSVSECEKGTDKASLRKSLLLINVLPKVNT